MQDQDMPEKKEQLAPKLKLREFSYSPQEELILSSNTYTGPIARFFIRLTAVFFVLVGLYDIIFMHWNTPLGFITHYLPLLIMYLLFETAGILKFKYSIDLFHFLITISAILPLLHLTVSAPAGYQQIYLFEAVLFTSLYYIAPGKNISTALTISVLNSLFFIGLLLVYKIPFDNRMILNLLFFHLLILGGLLLTYLIQAMLHRLVRISSELSSQNEVFKKLRDEFCKTLDGLSLGVLLCDSNGKILVYNSSFEELSGNQQLAEKTSIHDLGSIVQSSEKTYLIDLFESEVELNEELRLMKDGRQQWLSLKGLRIYPADSDHQYLILLEDITEQKRNQLARDRQQRYLQAVFNSESSIVLYERSEKGIYFTDNIAELTGYSYAEYKDGQVEYDNLIDEADRPFVQEKYENWCQSGKEGILYLWYRINRRDGQILWLEERRSRISDGAGKEIITGILIDTTELKTTERELRKSENALSRAQEIAHLGSWYFLNQNHTLEVSQELFRILEMAEEDASKLLNYENYIQEDSLEELRWKLSEFKKKNKTHFSHEFSIITEKGNEKVVALAMQLNRQSHDLYAIEGTLMDITAKKELERQLFQHQKMEAIGTLAGGIAHDFNNILNIIMGYSSVIKTQLPPEGKLWSKFDRITEATDRAKNLVNHILTISRQHDTRKRAINVKELTEKHLELMRSAIPALIEIKTNLNSNSYIYGNPDQLQQVVMNLCTNALYAMEPEGGLLEVSINNEGEEVVLEVKDTGSGIPSHVLEKMFDPYYTTKPKGKGTGLGLAIVKGIVDGLDGRIEVESKGGRGTRFQVYLPIYTGPRQANEEKKEEEKLKEQPDSRPKVMFIDDEEALRELFHDYLEASNLEVHSFSNGKDALEAMGEDTESWDILVSDISLPEMDGLEIVKRVRIINPELPVILYSGFKRPSFLEQARILKVDRMLIKPVVPENMLKEIKRILNGEE